MLTCGDARSRTWWQQRGGKLAERLGDRGFQLGLIFLDHEGVVAAAVGNLSPANVRFFESPWPVTTILRTGKTPRGTEVATVVKHTTRRLRQSAAWAGVFLICRHAGGVLSARRDSHHGRPEAMDWCEANGCGYIFGLAGNRTGPKWTGRGRATTATGTQTHYA